MDTGLVAAAGSGAEGVQIPFYKEGDDNGYSLRYETYYKKEPAAYSQFGYDAVMAIAKAIEKAGTTEPEAVKEALYTVEFDGASGHIAFDKYGEVEGKEFTWYQVENGQLVEEKS